MNSKTDLRIWAKSLRKTLDAQTKSLIIADKIRQLDCYKRANNIMLFYPKRYEVDLTLLLDDSKNFYLPRVCEDGLKVCPYKKGEILSVSGFNVCEPCSAPVMPSELDLVIVPALAVDRLNYRLGYGGGFYDRFLAENQIKSVLPIFNELVIDKLPIEEFDIPVDVVVMD